MSKNKKGGKSRAHVNSLPKPTNLSECRNDDDPISLEPLNDLPLDKLRKLPSGNCAHEDGLMQLRDWKDPLTNIDMEEPLLDLDNESIRVAVRGYLAGGTHKSRIVAKYGDISDWDVSNVTDMNRMFASATNFNQSLNNWDVSKVTDMSQMFDHATNFNQPLNKWDVSKVTDMGEMFWGATNFNHSLDNWDVSKVTDMRGMFGYD